MCGGAVGLVVGLVMTFLVGSHLPLRQARERAFLVGFIATGLPVFLLLLVLVGFHPAALVVAFLSALTGGRLSYWVAGIGSPRR